MLKVNNVKFSHDTESTVLKNISFTVDKGEQLCIMGESGCGKSTLLKIIYGLLDIDKGSLFWNDIKILGPKHHLVPGINFFKHVAQDFDLMPFISVSENIKKFLSRFYPEEAQKRTNELLGVIEMTEFANTKVKNLSGGQQQRVAIARALAKEPELLLLDEPFSQIDNFKKNSLRRKLFTYLKEKNISCIIATHDGNDALSFSDKMIVLKNQEIVASNTPSNLYKNPKTKYVASLFEDVNEIILHNKSILLYPHQIKIVPHSILSGIVIASYYKGAYWLIEVAFKKQTIFINNSIDLETNTIIYFQIP
ncbi:ABC transporter ATP-binding protein [Tenacibaculum maritimum]|uniref:ABC transporter, ATP-binding protein n=2 Tax=Tenacibaculum maritimum TaxID=107401 RepID=A0A2H1EDK0_9FLAO|nr:ABC transporter ATP-binding protein [Tenacibaculum maritimum]MCD9562166.1 ABC transporter ATP-binding protein [Tenacibaculum maritimum]MCD9565685.1 ABC transporter ATP-binding protein [Tenacibaculum maritimum]MCD9580264.1 ABC transporter ATP-binding protein [Tenacibaculum maritimum]MCD9596389.1 ABC transporter ATP-binding protein [Tenacibaculum maritimum]MCD9612571.1 ABC transporter ATP-binding protein [Tenacibaculum maritimum]